MITPDYKIKLIDLGVGLPMSGRNGDYFMHTFCGSNVYMAPEIIAKKPYQGKDIDVFSLVVVILTVRTMRYPFKKAT